MRTLSRVCVASLCTLLALSGFSRAASAGQTPFLFPVPDIEITSNPRMMAAGDFNGDGKPDVVLGSEADGSLTILPGNGDGTFQAPHNVFTAYTVVAVTVSDVNGDGKPDIVTINRAQDETGSAVVLLGSGDGTFRPGGSYPLGYAPSAVQIVDIDGDGKRDLVGTFDFGVSVLRGKGDGTFFPRTDYATGPYPYAFAVGDLNRDGRPDIVTANYSNGTASLLFNAGTGARIAGVVTLEGRGPASSPAHIVFTLRPDDGSGDIQFEQDHGSISPFALTNVPRKVYTLHIKGAITLAANVRVDATQADVSGIRVTLRSGDANGDNIIDIADFGLLVNAYGTDYLDTTGFYDDRADFDGDAVIDSNDFSLLVNNFGESGDP